MVNTDSRLGSEVLAATEHAWNAIRARHADLPPAVMTLGTGVQGAKLAKWGHWWASQWKLDNGATVGEVFIAGEGLGSNGAEVFETILHEAAHALGFVREISNTSRGGRYHNRRYRELGELVGLDVTQDKTYGWAITTLRAATSARYADSIADLDRAICGHRRLPVSPPRRRLANRATAANTTAETPADIARTVTTTGPSAGKRILLVCGCPEPRKLRLSASVAALGPIVCGVCSEVFHASA